MLKLERIEIYEEKGQVIVDGRRAKEGSSDAYPTRRLIVIQDKDVMAAIPHIPAALAALVEELQADLTFDIHPGPHDAR